MKKISMILFSLILLTAMSLTGCNFGQADSQSGTDGESANSGITSDGGKDAPPVTIENAVENGGKYIMPAAMSFLSSDLARTVSADTITVTIGDELSNAVGTTYLELYSSEVLQEGTILKYEDETAEIRECDPENNYYSLRATTGGKFCANVGKTLTVTIVLNIMVTLTATVSPADALVKTVDWSATWSETAALKDNPVSEYLTVTPTEDGSNVATVTCLRTFFDSDIVITVTARDGGKQAQCVVSCIGVPTTMRVNYDDWSFVQTEYYAYAPLTLYNRYYADIVLDNDFGSVSSKYYADDNFEIGFIGNGGIIVQNMTSSSANGTNGTWIGEEKTLTMADIADKIFSVSVTNGRISVSPVKTIDEYYGNLSRGTDGIYTYTNKFKRFSGDWTAESCCFYLTVKEKNTGLEYDMSIDEGGLSRIVVGQAVSSVTLSQDIWEI